MAHLCQLLLLAATLAPLCNASTVSYGSLGECQNAHMVPGYNLGGEGFDIVTMQRKGAFVLDTETWDLGNGSCKLVTNSYMGREKQKIPVSVVDWRESPQCALSVSSMTYDSAENLVNDSSSSVTNNWKVGLNIPVNPSVSVGLALGGSHSRVAKFAMEKSKEDHSNFYRHRIFCSYYRFRMASKPALSKEFSSSVNSLPLYSAKSANSYQSLIETYGTHFITQVVLGGEIKSITSVRTCQASLNGLTESEVKDCLSVEASANVNGKAGIDAMTEHCRAKSKKLSHGTSFGSMFSERMTETVGGVLSSQGDALFGHSDPSVYNTWLESLKTSPDAVRYNLIPLHTLLPDNHKAKLGIKKEVETYIKQNAVFKKCAESCRVGHRSSARDPCACVCNANPNVRSNCCPTGKGLATLQVYKLYAHGLYGDKWTQTDGSVEVVYGDQVKRTAVIDNNDNPRWSEWFNFGPITINMKDRLEFKVYDSDSYWNSDLLGECSFKLHQGKVSDACMFDYGTFYFSYSVECAPSLGGAQCQDYMPSPLSTSVAKHFYTRNGVLWKDIKK